MRFLLLTLEVLLFTIDFSAAIECQFRFIETDVEYLKTNETNSTKVQLSNPQPFECDVPGNEVVTVRFNVLARDNNYYKPEEDDYESTEVCEVRKRTIYPKALNSVTNQLIPVVNNKEVIQAIEAEECVLPKSACSGYTNNVKQVKSICVQKYVKIYLKALSADQRIYDEQFYFPSLCACDLIKVKRSTLKESR